MVGLYFLVETRNFKTIVRKGDPMDKKLYCRLSSDFRFEELEEAIGRLDDKYEARLFDIIKETVAVLPEELVLLVRELLIGREENNYPFLIATLFENLLEEYPEPFMFDGIGENEAWETITSFKEENYKKLSPLRDLFMASQKIGGDIINKLIDLGYVRRDLMKLDKWMYYVCDRYFQDYLSTYWRNNPGLYEIWQMNSEARKEKVLNFLKDKLSPWQYVVYEYSVRMLDIPRPENWNDEKSLFSNIERDLLYAAQRVVDLYRDEIVEILGS